MILDLMRGAIAMGFAVSAMFFLRFWYVSRDRLFAFFAAAFAVLAANRVLLAVFNENREHTTLLYTVRLMAFVFILAAIVDKNLRRSST
jgi:hypothetical protein